MSADIKRLDRDLGRPPRPTSVRLSQEDVAELKIFFEELIDRKLATMVNAAAAPLKFSSEDVSFLQWAMGFVAGANLERDGERGERIFARCRELRERLDKPGINPS